MARAEAYLQAKFHLDPSNHLATIHQRYRQTGQTDRQTDRQRTDSIGRTVLQTVAQKPSDFNESGKIPHQMFINLSNSTNKCSHLAEKFFKSHFTARRHKRIALETQSSFCAAKDTTFAVYQSCHVTSQHFSPKSGGLTRLGCSSVYMIEY